MPRNLDRRVEIMFPILDEKLKEKAMHILNVQLSDNLKAHVLGPDGIYNKIDRRGKVAIGAQDTFCKEAVEAVKAASEEVDPGEPAGVYSSGERGTLECEIGIAIVEIEIYFE